MITNGMKKIELLIGSQIPSVKQLFKSYIEDFLGISHFSIIIISKEKQAYITSTSTEFSENYYDKSLHKFDNTMCPLMYKNLDFYTWTEGFIKTHQSEINIIKKKFELNNGTVFVRRIPEYILLYCVATKKTDPIMKTIFVNNANPILELGDYCYNQLINDFENNFQELILPKIENFKPFLNREIPSLASYETSRKEKIIKLRDENYQNKITKLKLIVDNGNINK